MTEKQGRPMNRRQRRAARQRMPEPGRGGRDGSRIVGVRVGGDVSRGSRSPSPDGVMVGAGAVEGVMLRRFHLFYATVGGVLGVVVFGGMLWSGLNRSGRFWVGGTEFVVDVMLMSASALLAVVTGLAAMKQQRQIRQAPVTTWLSGTGGVAIEAATLRLRALSRNAGFFAAFWGFSFLLAATSIVTGAAGFNGVVAAVHLLAVLVSVFAVPMSSAAMKGWARRYRAVRQTGWRATKSVTVRRPYGTPFEPSVITVEFEDGSVIEVRTVESTYRAGHKEGQRLLSAWVGGTDSSMVVLFEHGPLRQGWYPVPVMALGARVSPEGTSSSET
ncbi:hypothetical protein [Amycolatopsis sp. WAC 04197]|uniref:hypothetical protein n=1 Tax=Amycolatopsis sp. WAC 04197 TaxID=2203199 RepID=UPI000F79AF1A|nr:hypothetical protein [Amycolatopsis sp. WAC 04197]